MYVCVCSKNFKAKKRPKNQNVSGGVFVCWFGFGFILIFPESSCSEWKSATAVISLLPGSPASHKIKAS